MRFCSLNTCRWIRVQGSVFHLYIDRVIVFIACPLRLVPLPSTLPGLRQHIPWLSQRRWLLRPSHSCLACGGHLLPGSVGGLGGGRARAALLRSWRLFVVVLRAALFAGVLRDATWIMSQCVQPFPMPFWAKPIIHVGLLFITTILACVRVPTHTQLCSAGFPGGFSVTAFHARFITLIVSRSHGACASSWHRGERNCTSTASKLSKTLMVSTPHPWLRGHFEGTDRSDPLNVGANAPVRGVVQKSPLWRDHQQPRCPTARRGARHGARVPLARADRPGAAGHLHFVKQIGQHELQALLRGLRVEEPRGGRHAAQQGIAVLRRKAKAADLMPRADPQRRHRHHRLVQ